jgi:hypothetical protein
VHIDVAAAMTGVSRFGEVRRARVGATGGWSYSKDEAITLPHEFIGAFDVLITAKSPAWFDEEDSAPPTQTAQGSCSQDGRAPSGISPFLLAHSEPGFVRVEVAWWKAAMDGDQKLARALRALKVPYLRVVVEPQIHVLVTRELMLPHDASSAACAQSTLETGE